MGKKAKKGKDPLMEAFEKDIQDEIDKLKAEGMKILKLGFKEAAKTAVKEVKSLHNQYVTQYYKSYNPSVYIRNRDPKHNLYSIFIKSRVYDNGNATIWFGYKNLEFYDHPQSDPGMVFDSFITNSRRSSPAVEAKYPKSFGVGVIKHTPHGDFDIMTGFSGHKFIYKEMFKKAQEKYIKKSGTYIVKYFNKHWDVFLSSHLNK